MRLISLVGEEGLEPSRIASLAPKASVSANSTTRPGRRETCCDYTRHASGRQLFHTEPLTNDKIFDEI